MAGDTIPRLLWEVAVPCPGKAAAAGFQSLGVASPVAPPEQDLPAVTGRCSQTSAWISDGKKADLWWPL